MILFLCPLHPFSHPSLLPRIFRIDTILLLGEAVAGADRVVVTAAVLAEVGVVWLAPFLGVEGAVGTVRDVVLAQEVSVEEFAGVVATIRARVAAVIGSCGVTGR